MVYSFFVCFQGEGLASTSPHHCSLPVCMPRVVASFALGVRGTLGTRKLMVRMVVAHCAWLQITLITPAGDQKQICSTYLRRVLKGVRQGCLAAARRPSEVDVVAAIGEVVVVQTAPHHSVVGVEGDWQHTSRVRGAAMLVGVREITVVSAFDKVSVIYRRPARQGGGGTRTQVSLATGSPTSVI